MWSSETTLAQVDKRVQHPDGDDHDHDDGDDQDDGEDDDHDAEENEDDEEDDYHDGDEDDEKTWGRSHFVQHWSIESGKRRRQCSSNQIWSIVSWLLLLFLLLLLWTAV